VSIWFKNEPTQICFWVLARMFLGFIIHEEGIEVDPDRIGAIQNMGAPTCKLEMQTFLAK
jgi:hypothetical protein